jgi:hypothetical protein
VQFYLSGFHKQSNLFASGAKISFYSETCALCDGGDDSADAITVRTKAKLKKATLQFTFTFPHDNESAPSAPH